VRVVSAAEIDAALAFPVLIEALRGAFAAGLVAPERHHHPVARVTETGTESATLLLMSAWTGAASKPSYLATKIATVFPGNAARGRPSVYATTLLLDGATGEPLAAMDGTRLTLWRTAATSALAACYLARPDASRLLMVGAGALAPFLIRAHCAIREIREVTIWNHNGARAEELVERMNAAETMGSPGEAARLRVTATQDLEAAARRADIISCATLSKTPLILGGWLAPGSHLDLVGAYSLETREADDEALRRARVYIDTKAALSEGGDIAIALRDEAISADRVLGDLAGLVSGRAKGRTSPLDVTLFKSIGAAIEDLAAAVAVWDGLR
jgi:ornithine cyclodeaminase/alanine dehydrogenase-like protein (mu-crystallin family)